MMKISFLLIITMILLGAGTTSTFAEEAGIDYLVLVNKLNPLPDGWEDALQTVTTTNSLGDEVEVETKTYDA